VAHLSFNSLFFNSIDTNQIGNSLTVNPHFTCPVCTGNPQHNLSSEIITIPTDSDLDFNQQVTFTLPCCGGKITLYLAVHKTRVIDDLNVCLSVAPIPEGWWIVQ
jgi:hypothetical protein